MGRRICAGRTALIVALLLPALLAPAAARAGGIDLGDQQVVTKKPRQGFLLRCSSPSPRKGAPLPWIAAGRWFPSKRPVVAGSVQHNGSGLSYRNSGRARRLNGNGLPDSHGTGAFPVGPASGAYPYPEARRAIVAHALKGRIPAPRKRPARPRCVGNGPLGVALDGVPLMPPSDGSGLDLGARSVQDSCGGTVLDGGRYVYRALPRCLDTGPKRRHSGLIGYARDGFGIYGPRGKGGELLHDGDLDACHGHIHRVRDERGRPSRVYHYHATAEFPYLVGCLHSRAKGWTSTPLAGPRSTIVTVTPGLFPAYSPGVSDYVIRCDGNPVTVSVAAADGTAVRVDRGPATSGGFERNVPLDRGQAFEFTVERAGEARQNHVRCLPGDFPAWSYERSSEPSNPLYFVTPTLGTGAVPYAIMFDRNGVPLWWYRSTGEPPLDAKVLSDGSLAWARFTGGGFGGSPDNAYEIRGLDGSLKRVVTTVGSPTDHHDLQEVGNGNLLMVTYRPRDGADLTPYGGPASATVMDSEIQEIDPNGDLVWSWNTGDHVALDETGTWWPTAISTASELPDGRTAYDATHINAVQSDGDKVIASFRHLNAVLEIDKASGDIDWKLGGTTTPESLTVLDDPLAAEPFGGQHDARLLPDGTLTVHDNGSGQSRPPRAVRYEIDPLAGTATLLESVSDPDVSGSFCCGSARRSPDGSWLMSWGGIPNMTEFAPDGSRAFRLGLGGTFSYRAHPIADGVLSPAALRAGMDAMYPRP
jgi:hypothetical protein